MNIVCVYSVDDYVSARKPFVAQFQIPYGISYIITVLQNAGHHVELLVFTPETDFSLIKDTIERFEPKMFCFTSVYTQYKLISNIAAEVKRIDPAIYTLIGGTHATLNPAEIINQGCFDAVCVGEGEVAVVELAEQLEIKGYASSINNIWFKRADGGIETNPQNPFIEDLDKLPFINREIWMKWVCFPERLTSVLVGRGCPFRCSYCSNHALSKVADGKYVRFRSVSNVVEEIKQIKSKFPGINTIYLEVETLGVNLEYTFSLCNELQKLNQSLERPLSFGTNFALTRNIIADPDTFAKKLKDANFKYINIGLESGSYRVRKEVLRRPDYKNEDVIKFCNCLKKNGVNVNMYVIIGLPDEKLSDYKQTVDCVRECSPNHVFLSIYYPYPGTDLHEFSKEKGFLKLVKKEEDQLERRSVYLKLPEFTERQIIREYCLFYYKVYKGKWPFYKIAAHVVRNMVSTNSDTNRLYRMMLAKYKILGRLRIKLTNNRI